MPIDPAVLLGGRGISLPDPMQLAQQQMTLAQLAQMRDARAYEIEKRKREEAKALAIQQALPMLLKGGSVADLASQFPEAGPDLLATDERMRKNKSDTAKSEAEAQAKRVDMQQKAMRDISNVAAQEAKNPNNLSLSRVQSVAKFYGVELPQPEGQDVGGYLSMLGNAGYDTKDRESLAETARGHTLTAETAAAGQRNQASIAAADRAERARAANMADARSANTTDRTLAKQDFANSNTLRDEFNKQSGDFIKVRDAHQRVLASAQNPSAAGDLALIFNYMKVLDPGSTVREGEFATAQNSGGVDSRVTAMYNSVLNGQRLAPEVRADFVARSQALYGRQAASHEQLRSQYTALAQRGGLNPENVVVDYRPKAEEAPKEQPSYKVGQKLDKMPDPKSLPVGSVINVDGTRYKTDGKNWVTAR